MHAILCPMSASRYLSKQVRYDNRTEGICFKIKISQVWLTPSSWSNEEYSRLASLIKAMDHISARAQTQHTHTHFKAALFFHSVLQCNESPCFLLYSLRTNTNTHTPVLLSVLTTVAAPVDTDAAPTHCVRACVCVLFWRSFVIKFDNSNEQSLVFLHSQCFLVKGNDSITKLSRLIIDYWDLFVFLQNACQYWKPKTSEAYMYSNMLIYQNRPKFFRPDTTYSFSWWEI